VVLGSGNRELGGGDRVELGGAEGGNEMVLGINWVCVSFVGEQIEWVPWIFTVPVCKRAIGSRF
jgi:hypothetical protein